MLFLKSLQSNFKFVLFIFVCNGIFAIWLNYISYFSDSPLWFAEKCAKSFGMIFVIEMTLLLVGYFLLKIIWGGGII